MVLLKRKAITKILAPSAVGPFGKYIQIAYKKLLDASENC